MLTVIIVIAVAYGLFHLGHAHANYRHGRARGRRGVNLYWSSVRGPWISIPGPFGTRIGHRLSSWPRRLTWRGYPVRGPRHRRPPACMGAPTGRVRRRS
jgi:hypothetical protein